MKKIWIYIKPFLDWKVLLIYLPIWFAVSGWTYVFIFVGTKYHITWMITSGSAWATFLWLPITPEKLITIPFCMWLYAKIFGGKSKSFEDMYSEAKKDWNATKKWSVKNYNKFIKTCLWALIILIVVFIII